VAKTMFGQLHTQIAAMTDISELRQGERGWKVEFHGEGATDQGGPYRESLTQLSTELYSVGLPLLISSPNNRVGIGNGRDKYVPNPSLNSPLDLSMYRVLGNIIGICIRTKNVYDLRFPSLVW